MGDLIGPAESHVEGVNSVLQSCGRCGIHVCVRASAVRARVLVLGDEGLMPQ